MACVGSRAAVPNRDVAACFDTISAEMVFLGIDMSSNYSRQHEIRVNIFPVWAATLHVGERPGAIRGR